MKRDFKWLILLGVNACAVLTVIVSHQFNPRVSDTAPELKAIEQAIQNTPAPRLDLSPIKAEVNELARLIKQMQNEDEASFNSLLSTIKTELQSKLDTMHDTIVSLEAKDHPIKMLPSVVLPFNVISIDSLQHTSVATVAYDYKTTALEKGDTLAGWQVRTIDFARQQIVFENDDGQVHVNLISGEAHA